LSTTAVVFDPQQVLTTSPVHNVIVTNIGTATLDVTGVTIPGTEFAQANDCGMVAPGDFCTIGTSFIPSQVGNRTDTLSIVSNAPGSPHTVALSGLGYVPAVVQIFATGDNELTVEREGGDPTQPLTVYYDVGGTAQLGTDYRLIPEPPTVVLPAGSMTSAVITAQPITPRGGSIELTLQAQPEYNLGASFVASLELSVRPPVVPLPVPAVTAWGMVLLGGLLGGIGMAGARSRRRNGRS
jgi:hypothetical protein